MRLTPTSRSGKSGTGIVSLHLQDKLRGLDFEPLNFRLDGVSSPDLLDATQLNLYGMIGQKLRMRLAKCMPGQSLVARVPRHAAGNTGTNPLQISFAKRAIFTAQIGESSHGPRRNHIRCHRRRCALISSDWPRPRNDQSSAVIRTAREKRQHQSRTA